MVDSSADKWAMSRVDELAYFVVVDSVDRWVMMTREIMDVYLERELA